MHSEKTEGETFLSVIKGKINAIQSLGTLDGPGVRFIVFLQGCNLKCGCCHNPETQSMAGGTQYTVAEIVNKAVRYKEYFGKNGGITLSGGEPLLQADFAKEVFTLCHKNGINTCLDTSGSVLNQSVLELLEVTDCVLLDIKYTTDELYKEYAGCSINKPLEFLKACENKNVPVILRQVIIPTLNDNDENILRLKEVANAHKCVIKTELLPFKKLCVTKYEKLNMPFRFENLDEPDKTQMDRLNGILLN